jgi:hypothetical protein
MVLYPGQATVQTVLVAIAVLAVPCMLFPKPLLLRAEHKEGYKQLDVDDNTEMGAREGDSNGVGHEGRGEFDFADCMIHQSIHVIEFVLGSVSNTVRGCLPCAMEGLRVCEGFRVRDVREEACAVAFASSSESCVLSNAWCVYVICTFIDETLNPKPWADDEYMQSLAGVIPASLGPLTRTRRPLRGLLGACDPAGQTHPLSLNPKP